MPTLRLLIVESNFGRQKREWNSGRQSRGQKVKSLACALRQNPPFLSNEIDIVITLHFLRKNSNIWLKLWHFSNLS